VRFLHLVKREVIRTDPEAASSVDSLEIDALEDCDETIERLIPLPAFHPLGTDGPWRVGIDLSASRETTIASGRSIVRSSEAIVGEVVVEAVDTGHGAVRISVSIANLTPLPAGERVHRDDALRRSMLSVHVVLTAHDGAFVSLLDPADSFREPAAQCHQDGLYPVLAEEEGDRRCVLASPIILYDHPQVAPESPGDLFDGTEIDEILTLRIQTLSEDEKREIRSADARTRQLLERADSLEPEMLARLHGAMRTASPTGDSQ
jgi:hydrogenase maturation protease